MTAGRVVPIFECGLGTCQISCASLSLARSTPVGFSPQMYHLL